ncbi:hypothetical protein [Desulforamulus profundi]
MQPFCYSTFMMHQGRELDSGEPGRGCGKPFRK